MNSTNAMSKIDQIDLDQIKVKLMHAESGEGWSLDRANAIEVEYRRFLCMMQMYPHENIAPLVDVDTFWHYHILDTRKYAADCQRAFGHFLHHNPNIGLEQDDAADHHTFGARMHALYEATFGEACLSGAHAAGTGAAAKGTAWCALDNAAAKDATAWCAVATEKPSTAWCAATGERATAWCAMADKQATAWCAMAGKQATAWCAVAGKQATAWCAAAEKRATAWCAVAADKQSTAGCAAAGKQSTAWCVATALQATAWCAATSAALAA